MNALPDSREIREFVETYIAQARAATKEIKRPGVLQMILVHPNDDEVTSIYRYMLDDDRLAQRMSDDAIKASKAGHNVYVEGRTVRQSLKAKQRGGYDDTVAVFSLIVDSDADKQMGWEPNASASPSMSVETSPGNFQYWYFFRDAVAADIGQQLGERIRKAVNCDHDTGNVVQPYRVAGTANYPNKKKRERGRITVQTQLKGFNPQALWTPEDIERAFQLPEPPNNDGGTGGGNVDEASIPADTMRVIREGLGTSASKRDRSQTFWNVMIALKQLSFTVDSVVNLLEHYPNGIANKYEGRLRQEVERVYSKLRETDHNKILAELNPDNAVVLDHGRTMVLRFEDVPHEAGGERYVYHLPTFLRFEDFKNFYLNRYINVGDDAQVSIGKWWLAHTDRRQYRSVVFTPGGGPVIDGRLNLWRGWGVEPKRGDWGRMREHIGVVLAAGDEAVDRYIIKWLAWGAQHPAEQAEVALVFRGEVGTGRGTLGKYMCRIYGQHARHISSPHHLTGKFNAHLRQCCFLFGDECYAPTDKKAEGIMKRMITEPTLDIEPKGREAGEEPNRLKVMLASNHD